VLYYEQNIEKRSVFLKTLYLSDLDGTLLQPDESVSQFSVDTLNRLIESGVSFSFASARSNASALKITQKLNLNMPVIMLNGVLIYDCGTKKFLKVEYIPQKAVQLVCEAMKKCGINGFLYSFEDEKIVAHYEQLDTEELLDVKKDRTEKYNKKFVQVNDFSEVYSKPNVYFSIIALKEKLDVLHEMLSKEKELSLAYYADVYHPGVWYLEVFSSKASKFYGAQFIREYIKADKVVGFGDNFNDMPLKKAVDMFCAVGNALPEIKELADVVIGKNTEDGVARYIAEQEQK